MSERFKELVLKTSEHASVPWVRTPLSPSIRVHECCSTAGGLFFCAEKLMYGFGIKTTGGRHLSDDGVRITGYNTIRARVYFLLLSDLRVFLVKITKKELTKVRKRLIIKHTYLKCSVSELLDCCTVSQKIFIGGFYV